MSDNVDRLADALAERITPQPVEDRPQQVTRRWAVVTAVNAGPPASVDLDLAGVAIPGVRYLASYSPVNGDTVVLDVAGSDPLVLGDLA